MAIDYKYEGVARDGAGNIINAATISVYLAGTTTEATVYEEEDDVAHVHTVTCDDDGQFEFWVRNTDYNVSQKFKISAAKSGYVTKEIDDIVIFPIGAVTGNTAYADNTAAKAGGLVDGDIYRTAAGIVMVVYT